MHGGLFISENAASSCIPNISTCGKFRENDKPAIRALYGYCGSCGQDLRTRTARWASDGLESTPKLTVATFIHLLWLKSCVPNLRNTPGLWALLCRVCTANTVYVNRSAFFRYLQLVEERKDALNGTKEIYPGWYTFWFIDLIHPTTFPCIKCRDKQSRR